MAKPKFTDSTVRDAESHVTKYVTDGYGRPVQTTNAKSQTTKMSWDADNNVTYLEEANGAKTAYCYDQKTGYPLWSRDAENNKNGVPPATDCAPAPTRRTRPRTSTRPAPTATPPTCGARPPPRTAPGSSATKRSAT
ncbi:hypothetical protein ABZ839_33760 [Streptomyces cellulosae]